MRIPDCTSSFPSRSALDALQIPLPCAKTKEGVVSSVNTVANRTTEQANIVADSAVMGANEMSQKTVEGVENVAASTGFVTPGDFSQGRGTGEQGGDEGY
ncbi:synuclein-like [Arapaima gigas]